jgi:hypothetical protein
MAKRLHGLPAKRVVVYTPPTAREIALDQLRDRIVAHLSEDKERTFDTQLGLKKWRTFEDWSQGSVSVGSMSGPLVTRTRTSLLGEPSSRRTGPFRCSTGKV